MAIDIVSKIYGSQFTGMRAVQYIKEPNLESLDPSRSGI
jgi:hypothetical protein